MENKLLNSIKILKETFDANAEYKEIWTTTIAMSFKNLIQYNVLRNGDIPVCVYTADEIDKIANQAANDFLKKL